MPELTLATADDKPDLSVERENSLTMAFTLMQETLKPMERAVFLLREVFDYDYADTAAIVGKAEANCRQIVRRAKAQLQAISTPPTQPSERARRLVGQFVSPVATGEVSDLLALVGAAPGGSGQHRPFSFLHGQQIRTFRGDRGLKPNEELALWLWPKGMACESIRAKQKGLKDLFSRVRSMVVQSH